MKKGIFYLALILLASCSANKYAATNRSYKKQSKVYAKEIKRHPLDASAKDWVGTTNFNMRKPNFVVIHHTAQNSCEQTLRTFTLPRTQVSAHYVICRDGTVFHMLNDYLRAWHAGLSSWGNDKDINSSSIGIELDNDGYETFTEPQIASLLTLLDTLKHKYSIPTANFMGHGDIAPRRKNDPNVNFPWEELAESGYGIWYGDTTNIELPDGFDPVMGLKIIGYSVEDLPETIRAFRQHFLGENNNRSEFTTSEEKIIYDLMLQVMNRKPQQQPVISPIDTH